MELEHDPTEGEELEDGGDFTGPVRGDADAAVAVPDGPCGEGGEDIAEDDEACEPEGDLVLSGPWGDAEDDEGREHEKFVSERVEDAAEGGVLVEAAGDPAVEGVAEAGGEEDGHGGEAEWFIRLPCGDAGAVTGGEPCVERDESQPDEGDLRSEGHRGRVGREGGERQR